MVGFNFKIKHVHVYEYGMYHVWDAIYPLPVYRLVY